MSLFSWLFPRRAMIQENKHEFVEGLRSEVIAAIIHAGMGKGRKIEPNYRLFYSETRIVYKRKR